MKKVLSWFKLIATMVTAGYITDYLCNKSKVTTIIGDKIKNLIPKKK